MSDVEIGIRLPDFAEPHLPTGRRFDAFERGGIPVASPPVVETFRLLALSIDRLIAGSDQRSIAVISAFPGDGRSMTSELVARALCEIRPPVAIVDADPFGNGLRTVVRGWWLPKNGKPPQRSAGSPGPLTLLRPDRAGSRDQPTLSMTVEGALGSAIRRGMTTVVDTPACTVSSLAFSVASMTTGVLYVARKRRRSAGLHRDIRAQLDILGARVLGVVFNEG
jgi:Mrp family chromosome partitioning ATPase